MSQSKKEDKWDFFGVVRSFDNIERSFKEGVETIGTISNKFNLATHQAIVDHTQSFKATLQSQIKSIESKIAQRKEKGEIYFYNK